MLVEPDDSGALADSMETPDPDPARAAPGGGRIPPASSALRRTIRLRSLMDRCAGRRLSGRDLSCQRTARRPRAHAHSVLRPAEAADPSGAVGRSPHGAAVDGGARARQPSHRTGEPLPQPRRRRRSGAPAGPGRSGPASGAPPDCAISRAPAEPSVRRLWFTYHLYYKAPDWLGPAVSAALDIPYVVAEVSHAGKRAGGRGPSVTRRRPDAIGHADAIITLNPADAECLAGVADPSAILASC